MNIAEIDKNFITENEFKEGTKAYSVKEKPFKVYGLYNFEKDGDFKRMDPEVAEKIGTGIRNLYKHTSGGRIRFKTDSDYIGLYVKMSNYWDMAHITSIGRAGFDMYVRERSCLVEDDIK